jgi:glycosyltransferase involved in cell wall biosynthesis
MRSGRGKLPLVSGDHERVRNLGSISAAQKDEGVARPSAEMLRPERVLVLSNCNPFPPTNGIALRVWSVLQALAANGHEIELLCFGDASIAKKDLRQALEICKFVKIIEHPTGESSKASATWRRVVAMLTSRRPFGTARSRSEEMQSEILDRLQRRSCDVMLCEETDLLGNVPDELPVPLIIDHHNVEYLLLQRYLAYERNLFRCAYGWIEAQKVRRWERCATLRANVAMVCSDVDRLIYQKLCPSVPVIVVPNVINSDAYIPSPNEEPNTVLYTGGMDWYPNRDAVEFFAFSILPLIRKRSPETRFIVAGRGPTPSFLRRFAGSSSIEFTGSVADMRPQIARATVCVVPLRIGSGTRLKILEAAAMAKPIVSTRVGAEGLDFADGKEIVLADEPEPFASAVVDLIHNAHRRRSLGAGAQERVKYSYSYSVLRDALRSGLAILKRIPPSVPYSDNLPCG